MAKQKIEIEVDIPDGYEFVRFGVPAVGESFISPGGTGVLGAAGGGCTYPRFIVREAWQWPMWLKADYIAMDAAGTWRAFGDCPTRWADQWFGDNHFYLNKSMLDFTPPPCDDWTQSLRVRPGVEQKETAK